ncbi:uncharacterized protein TRIADDRAFT_60887 [Trichoplax adhaerens]|uniref:Ion transport domain-containing protein n=1 Tax=Trichoplax adhaerens TaxID=10228 RepID=B3S9F5_TRIAD|nr:hypothetical protein TRIADDRAFT_60887 [Trichoplax adhaerens]EDV20690.1 hypothetical protein TRIADDRAFT_60887 [Trichoplax adhaerens]|eukprot:XP_002116890.1 hypothetical protein TRIADDRAFT_60887 [Trichoplax adhaerens]
MMIGEMEYTDSWMSQIQKNKIPLPKSVTALVMIVIFIFLMPIVLTNLMVGLAVGDIDKVRREAGFRLLSSRVEYLDDLERTLPLRFRNRFYKRGHTDKYTKKLNQADNKNMESTSAINKSDITSADPKFVSAIERIGNQEKRIEFLTEQFMAFREDVMKSFKKIDEALNIDQI